MLRQTQTQTQNPLQTPLKHYPALRRFKAESLLNRYNQETQTATTSTLRIMQVNFRRSPSVSDLTLVTAQESKTDIILSQEP